jgi:hypothetical protein
MSEVSPKDFINWTLSRFTNVHAIRHNAGGNYLECLPPDGAMNFLHTNMVHNGLVTDLLVTNFPGRLSLSPAARQSKVNLAAPRRGRRAADRDTAHTVAIEADMTISQHDRLVANWNSWHATRRRFTSLTRARLLERLGRLHSAAARRLNRAD